MTSIDLHHHVPAYCMRCLSHSVTDHRARGVQQVRVDAASLGPPSTSPTAIGKIWSPRWQEPDTPTSTNKRLQAQFLLPQRQKLTQIYHHTAKTNALELIKQDGRTDPESIMRA